MSTAPAVASPVTGVAAADQTAARPVRADAAVAPLCIALVGLPGSGKSTIGQHLARQLGLTFVDVDTQIETYLGGTIREYFAAHGEPAFRDVESLVLTRCLEAVPPKGCVMATGGGVVLREANRRLLRQHSTVFYLHAAPAALARRLKGDRVRPLMQVADPQQRIVELARVRGPLYQQTAHFTVETARQGVAQMAGKIRMQAELAGILP